MWQISEPLRVNGSSARRIVKLAGNPSMHFRPHRQTWLVYYLFACLPACLPACLSRWASRSVEPACAAFESMATIGGCGNRRGSPAFTGSRKRKPGPASTTKYSVPTEQPDVAPSQNATISVFRHIQPPHPLLECPTGDENLAKSVTGPFWPQGVVQLASGKMVASRFPLLHSNHTRSVGVAQGFQASLVKTSSLRRHMSLRH
ncbi:hypothetical protein B0T24DRAFT_61676 [Lasiosphaeria ovina]|uniref:Uncharacterized protein n=1 Tax=Lasiosphaeria ovina TaxID=92902 RepID=A0AAE0TY57_9PEZI|nr:hypothetical protein B0T24DRAFT_61676 [Lasiosphaeria ovina]